jgi:hypothetical protein
LFSAAVCSAQDKPAQHGQPDPAAMQKMWEGFMKAGPQHEMMKRWVGSWKTVTKDYMMDPNQPTVAEGKAEFKMMLGDRFLVQHFHSTSNGMPFEGVGMSGYDNQKKKFVGTWADNMGTGIMNTEGTYDEATKTMTETGEMSSPMGTMKLNLVTQQKTDNEFVFTMYMINPDGGKSKAMEITYTRM